MQALAKPMKHLVSSAVSALAALIVAACLVAGQEPIVEGGCPAGLQGECNGCICCCYKSAIPKYVPSGCECKIQFDSNFIVMAVFVVATFIASGLTSWHFSNYSRTSPYKPSTDLAT